MEINLDIIAVFLPLAGAVAAWLPFGKRKDIFAAVVTCFVMFLSAFLSFAIFNDLASGGDAQTHVLGRWLESGNLNARWAVRIDMLSSLMMAVVSAVSAAVHIYSVGYMRGDKGFRRFMSYLSLFTFFMLFLVVSDNMPQMFFGWEGVGLCSYLLIGFWHEKKSASDAAIKAFVVNRVGDIGFVVGIIGCYSLFGTLDFDAMFDAAGQAADMKWSVAGFAFPALTVVCLLLSLGAMAKSAQLGLHTWLPDAMEGPTPVSALIHAATMVAAGVFMIARMSPLFEQAPAALAFVGVVGALTAFVAATMACVQFDIKRVIAYSTMSQLGYMFFALGVSAYSAALFHLTTHAFFKALLFLGAGSAIHAVSGEQDMRCMGGMRKKTPATYAYMLIGSAALTGICFSGFYSKDFVLESAASSAKWFGLPVYLTGLGVAALTAYYAARLMIMVFHGKKTVVAHESPKSMLIAMFPLALCAALLGGGAEDWFRQAFYAAKVSLEIPEWAKFLPLFFALSGMAVAYRRLRDADMWFLSSGKLPFFRRVVANKYYFDEVYDFLFAKLPQSSGRFLWKESDGKLIDGAVDGAGCAANRLSRPLSSMQNGHVYSYAFVMIASVVVAIVWVLVRT